MNEKNDPTVCHGRHEDEYAAAGMPACCSACPDCGANIKIGDLHEHQIASCKKTLVVTAQRLSQTPAANSS